MPDEQAGKIIAQNEIKIEQNAKMIEQNEKRNRLLEQIAESMETSEDRAKEFVDSVYLFVDEFETFYGKVVESQNQVDLDSLYDNDDNEGNHQNT